MPKVAIIGAGRVGKTLGLALKEKGYDLVGVVTGNDSTVREAARLLGTASYKDAASLSKRAELVFITTPDRFIKTVTDKIALEKGFKHGQVVLHTSGSHSSDILRAASDRGARTVSLHPLQTFPDVDSGLKALAGTYFAVEGEKEALVAAAQVVKDLGGHYFEISKELKPLYHASACIVCNYLITLLDMGLNFFKKAGAGEADIKPFLPLIEATLENAVRKGTVSSLTGPIARGDSNTIDSHLELIEKHLPHYKNLYSVLGEHTVSLAQLQGTLDAEQGKKIIKILGGARDE